MENVHIFLIKKIDIFTIHKNLKKSENRFFFFFATHYVSNKNFKYFMPNGSIL